MTTRMMLRRWSVRHARALQRVYEMLERCLIGLHPIFERIGYARLEAPVAGVERVLKGLLFDCQMCGQCVLGETGMSCPMNCPKRLRNGPCGGVRSGGMCEVLPAMRCVWVEAQEGAQRMRGGAAALSRVQVAVDFRRTGRSSWLAVARTKGSAASNLGSTDVEDVRIESNR